MKRSLLSFLCCLLVITMVISALSSCAHSSSSEDTTASEATESETVCTDSRETECTTVTDATESETSSEREDDTANTEDTAQSETEETEPRLEGEHAALVDNAHSLKNKITAYYGDGSRSDVFFENTEMLLGYNISADRNQVVSSLANKNGGSYISNTMDVFVRMENGTTYFAGASTANAFFNIHRFGYYFYQMRLEGQDFLGSLESLSTLDVDLSKNS